MTNDKIIRQALQNVWQNPRVYYTWKHAHDACRARGRALVIFDGDDQWEMTDARYGSFALGNDPKRRNVAELARMLSDGFLEACVSGIPA